MATKLNVPRPVAVKKVQPQEIALDAKDLVEESDNTEPAGPPVMVEWTPPPNLPGTLITPPAPVQREIAMSLPSQFEIDSERKSSPPIAMRRKELAKYVASAVGVAWFICTCAIGETAFRSIIASMH